MENKFCTMLLQLRVTKSQFESWSNFGKNLLSTSLDRSKGAPHSIVNSIHGFDQSFSKSKHNFFLQANCFKSGEVSLPSRLKYITYIKKMSKLCLVLATCFLSTNLSAQQEIQNTFYMFNGSALNPAYAGSRSGLSSVIDYRSQWSGWKGAPVISALTIHSPLKNESIGLGINSVIDQLGPTSRTSLFADFAYRIKVNKSNDRLCFGLRGGADLIRNDFASLAINNAADPVVANNANFNSNLPNVGFGIYSYGNRHFIGITAPKILSNNLSKDASFSNSKQIIHYYFIAGYVIKINSLWDFKVGSAIRYTDSSPLSVDVNGSFLYNNVIWIGAVYRHKVAAGANIVYNITPQFRIGYAFDYSTTDMGNYNPGTHEVMIGYDFAKKSKGIKSPRYF